jgi:hypothetical protein
VKTPGNLILHVIKCLMGSNPPTSHLNAGAWTSPKMMMPGAIICVLAPFTTSRWMALAVNNLLHFGMN